jgi:hypothetical protein
MLALSVTRELVDWLILRCFKDFFQARHHIISVIYLRSVRCAGFVARHACSATSRWVVGVLLLFGH